MAAELLSYLRTRKTSDVYIATVTKQRQEFYKVRRGRRCCLDRHTRIIQDRGQEGYRLYTPLCTSSWGPLALLVRSSPLTVSPPLPPSTFSHSSLCLRLLPLSIQSHPPSSSSLRSSGSVIRLPGRQRYLFPSPLLPSAAAGWDLCPLLSLASGLGGTMQQGPCPDLEGASCSSVDHLSPADRSGSLVHFWGDEFIAFIIRLGKCGHEIVNI